MTGVNKMSSKPKKKKKKVVRQGGKKKFSIGENSSEVCYYRS